MAGNRPPLLETAKTEKAALILVEDFHKHYGDRIAVAGLSFRVEAGDILGLVGPNGAGKTTTLRSLAGIISPTKGRLQVAGYDVAASPIPAKSHLAYVPDDPHLFDELTVWEHIQFAAAAYQVGNFEAQAEKLLADFELAGRRNTVCRELSRGMRQKVAICCAFLHQPKVMLFDEPLTGLDPRAIRTLKEKIRHRAAAGDATVLSSHLLTMVEDFCTNHLILHQGQKRFFGNLSQARAAFGDLRNDTSLEEIFFRATEETAAKS